MKCIGKKTAMILVLALAALASAFPAFGQQPATPEKLKITVSGEAVVYVQPDKILISLGVETWNADVDAAKLKNDAIVKKAIEAIIECGVKKNAIQTDSLTIDPTYESRGNHSYRIIDGYVVRNSLTVTVTNVALVEPLITATLKVGVNHINNVDFQTTELRKYRDQARKMALKAAREKAKDMADVLDQSIGKPLQINENQGFGYFFYSGQRWGSSGRDYGMSQNVAQNMPSSDGGAYEGETVTLGKIGIRANVNVVFELKDK